MNCFELIVFLPAFWAFANNTLAPEIQQALFMKAMVAWKALAAKAWSLKRFKTQSTRFLCGLERRHARCRTLLSGQNTRDLQAQNK
mmetsp:Transcript_60423/g.110911  ORF Transcript_60423/g.110911 Transcript_60423/m.110911 type:complete len:86 (+) Transcript_60423:190-447(+)